MLTKPKKTTMNGTISTFQNKLSTAGITIDASLFPYCQFRFPAVGIILYLITTIYFQPSNDHKTAQKQQKVSSSSSKDEQAKPKNKPITKMKLLMFVHNLVLCVFSALCFYNTFPIIFEILSNGFYGALCGKKLENEYIGGINSTFGYWTFLFYLSKYYEFIDTFIVILRGRRPIFLQTFHHCGAVFGMWLVLVTQCTGGWIFVVENSFIHTIMYFYYAMSSINIRLPGKFIITQAQMIQFVIGNSFGFIQIFGYGQCMRYEDKATIWYHVIYTSCLLILFRAFYVKSYSKKKKTN